jgi:hypothetical protein
MAHRLSVTKVHFHTRRDPEDIRPLGDLNESGAMATDFFSAHFDRAMWNERNDDDEPGDASGKRHAVRGICEILSTGQPDIVAGMMLAGERGIVAEYYADDFVTKTGDRDEGTIEAPRVLALAYMPHRSTDGYLVTHSYHNRYFKTGLMASLRPAVVNAFGGELTIKMDNWAPMADVAAMIQQGPILKMLKAWNRQIDRHFRSFHLEVLAWKIFDGITISNPWSGVRYFFENARSLVPVKLPDPVGYSPDVASYLHTQAHFDAAVSRLKPAHGRATKAEDLAKNGKSAEAFAEWRKIFGDYFPSYG